MSGWWAIERYDTERHGMHTWCQRHCGCQDYALAAAPAPADIGADLQAALDDAADYPDTPKAAPASALDVALSRIRSHAFGPCLVCGAQADDPEALEACAGPVYDAAAGEGAPIERGVSQTTRLSSAPSLDPERALED